MTLEELSKVTVEEVFAEAMRNWANRQRVKEARHNSPITVTWTITTEFDPAWAKPQLEKIMKEEMK
jgi:hypothetical protein